MTRTAPFTIVLSCGKENFALKYMEKKYIQKRIKFCKEKKYFTSSSAQCLFRMCLVKQSVLEKVTVQCLHSMRSSACLWRLFFDFFKFEFNCWVGFRFFCFFSSKKSPRLSSSFVESSPNASSPSIFPS